MNRIVTLTEVKEDRHVHVNSIGLINQMIFEKIDDALYYLFSSNPTGSIITLNKTSCDFSWIKIENEEKARYYEFRVVKPIRYE